MSQYWSGLFLVGTITLSLILIVVALLMRLLKTQNRVVNAIFLSIIVLLVAVWVSDRFIVGALCYPWECINPQVDTKGLLLEKGDLPEGWMVGPTLDYTYDTRAAASYEERSFQNTADTGPHQFFQEIYQYLSVRGASFQYEGLINAVPGQYVQPAQPIPAQLSFPDGHATQYFIGRLDDSAHLIYYVAQYRQYLVVLAMPYSQQGIPPNEFIALVRSMDKKFYKVWSGTKVP